MIRELWTHRQQAFFTPLMALGVWRLREEGGFYVDGDWCWRFWRPYPYLGWAMETPEIRWPFLFFLRGWPCR